MLSTLGTTTPGTTVVVVVGAVVVVVVVLDVVVVRAAARGEGELPHAASTQAATSALPMIAG